MGLLDQYAQLDGDELEGEKGAEADQDEKRRKRGRIERELVILDSDLRKLLRKKFDLEIDQRRLKKQEERIRVEREDLKEKMDKLNEEQRLLEEEITILKKKLKKLH